MENDEQKYTAGQARYSYLMRQYPASHIISGAVSMNHMVIQVYTLGAIERGGAESYTETSLAVFKPIKTNTF